MNLLLDTCALIRLSQGLLNPGVVEQISIADAVITSVVSPWEIGIKVSQGKLKLSEPVGSWYEGLSTRYNLEIRPLDAATVCRSSDLPPIHRDPFDRVLIAIALHHSLTIITSDRTIPQYPNIQTLW